MAIWQKILDTKATVAEISRFPRIAQLVDKMKAKKSQSRIFNLYSPPSSPVGFKNLQKFIPIPAHKLILFTQPPHPTLLQFIPTTFQRDPRTAKKKRK